MHVFSCLEVEGSLYDSQYGMKHHYTLLDDDYKLWEEQAKKCMTLGCNAELYAILFQIPSYIPSDDIEMILDSFDKIAESVEAGTVDNLIASYPELFDNLPIYAPKDVFDNRFKKLNEHKEIILNIINSFKELLSGLWERFYNNYWEKEAKLKLERKATLLNKIISPINIIGEWKKTLKIDFPYEEFIVYLVEPTNAIATDLLAEKIVIAEKHEDNDVYRILVHEIGRSFLLNTKIFENEKLAAITESNIDRFSVVVDAACIYLKNALFNTLRIKSDEPDPYDVQTIKEVIAIFENVWNSLKEKDIYEALIQTYDKLSPVV